MQKQGQLEISEHPLKVNSKFLEKPLKKVYVKEKKEKKESIATFYLNL